MESRNRRPLPRSGTTPRKPMVIKPRRELRRQGQFLCSKCQTIHLLSNWRNCCKVCSTCCTCKGNPVLEPMELPQP